ncbi:LLM class flavin-dependent oxidoreductase [Nocardia sp. CDC159]|uniref:LLM class flavin-dependent oxidoreductase n=1 Tax=Nocardia pulmonis TaxID=2951408 RepID=A0A9X2IXI1_9NOCA|nr:MULTISPECIES: LLM class flavin-dependent oxidoreductase [Nocardia]MCM6775403.1 LLM class flavin-dependent oxidoreductase [Nocardia pulmonis]MCM6787863.1 LLM class flavin-dependent oxidoreductase [Nocardia sp. CDC159]
MALRYAINVPNFGDFADPRTFAELAARAEAAGWDGLLVWDHLVYDKTTPREIGDPWVLLTAAALATERIRLGTAVTPVARRRPQQLAREVATLDRLSGGRMVLGVGLGGPIPDEYGSFGEPTDPRELAGRLDEGLAALDLLWSGETVSYRGEYVTLDEVRFLPPPVQRPRVPIWVGGQWPNKAPMRRAARYDGVIPILSDVPGTPPRPEDVRALREFIGGQRDPALSGHPFDVVCGGATPPEPGAARRLLDALAEAGMTWWQERMPAGDRLERADPMLRRVDAGPPR